MSDSKTLPAAPPETDLNLQEMEIINKFIDDGRPGIQTIPVDLVERICELYLSGKPYGKIARDLRISKSIVCYLSYTYNWYPQRKELLEETARHLEGRLIEAKLSSKNTLVNLAQAFEKRLGEKLYSYYATGNDSHFDSIDKKLLDQYLKIVDMIGKASAKDGVTEVPPRQSLIGLNVGEGVTISKGEGNSVEITPKTRKIGDLLHQFAESRRQQESEQARPRKPDIPTKTESSEELEKQGEDDET